MLRRTLISIAATAAIGAAVALAPAVASARGGGGGGGEDMAEADTVEVDMAEVDTAVLWPVDTVWVVGTALPEAFTAGWVEASVAR